MQIFFKTKNFSELTTV